VFAQSDDESIFAWLSSKEGEERGMLADSPSEFQRTGSIRPIYVERKRPPASFTSRGLEIHHAYTHPFTMMWDEFCGSVLGGRLFPVSETLPLRLDCELTDQGVTYGVGVSLSRDPTTGNWYRQDASNLLYARYNASFQKTYPAFAGFKRIYIDTPKQGSQKANSPRASAKKLQAKALFKYESMSFFLMWLIAEMLSAASCTWLLSALNYHLGLEALDTLLSWACLTGVWHLQGQRPGFVVSVLIQGMCGREFDLVSYSFRNMFIAFLGLMPMSMLQLQFDMLMWNHALLKQ
jgi:hypothetical protein